MGTLKAQHLMLLGRVGEGGDIRALSSRRRGVCQVKKEGKSILMRRPSVRIVQTEDCAQWARSREMR